MKRIIEAKFTLADQNKVIVRSYRMVGSYNGTPGSGCWQAIGY